MNASHDIRAGRIMRQEAAAIPVVYEKPVKYLENVWGQDVRMDPKNRSYDMSEFLKPKNFGGVRDTKVGGSMPFLTTPKLRFNRMDRMIPEETFVSSVCLKEELDNRGPWYNTYLPPVDLWPIKPTRGDITKEPKYIQDYTKRRVQNYRKVW